MREYSIRMKSRANAHRIVAFLLISILSARLFYLQVMEFDKFSTLSEKNRLRTHTLLAPRGLIMDKRGNVLAENRPSYSVYLYERDKTKIEEVIDKLDSLIEVDSVKLKDRIDKEISIRKNKREALRLFRDIRYSDVCVLKEHLSELPGVEIESEPVRYYTYPFSTAHLLGNMGEIGRDEWPELKKRGYAFRALKGVSGIEKQCEDLLRGRNGISFVEVDAAGHRVGDFGGREAKAPVPGYSVYLNIDITLQDYARRLMEGREGAVVAIEPKTGNILTLVSSPVYDGNLFSGGGITKQQWKELTENQSRPLFNRAVSSRYPPGSTYKLIVGLFALENHLVEPNQILATCTGSMKLGTRVFKCWKTRGHGPVNFYDAFRMSCDVYYYNIGLKMDIDALADFSGNFGLGRITGVELPGESRGLLPDSEWYRRKYGINSVTRGYCLNLSIGQGEILVTPLQMASAFGAVAVGGELHPPRLIDRYENPTVKRTIVPKRPPAEKLPVSSENIKIMKECLRQVVNEPGGTGHKAALEGVTVGGKTGTAQNETGVDHAWFCGVAPLEDPRIAVAVIIERGGHGGDVAAPIAGKLIGWYLDEDK